MTSKENGDITTLQQPQVLRDLFDHIYTGLCANRTEPFTVILTALRLGDLVKYQMELNSASGSMNSRGIISLSQEKSYTLTTSKDVPGPTIRKKRTTKRKTGK